MQVILTEKEYTELKEGSNLVALKRPDFIEKVTTFYEASFRRILRDSLLSGRNAVDRDPYSGPCVKVGTLIKLLDQTEKKAREELKLAVDNHNF